MQGLNGKTGKSTERGISRRRFLGGATSAAAFTVLPRYVLGGTGYTAPSDKLNVAVIGTGGQGMVNIRALLELGDVQVTAVCDVAEQTDYSDFYFGGSGGREPARKLVDEYYAGREASKDYKKCGVYIDFRRMFEKEKGIDAVLVATPDHNHAITTMAAIENGKGVYCEKPLARTVYEARRITEASREAGVATQLGNQGHSDEGIRLTCEWIWDGAIGDVREVYAWTSVGGGAGCRSKMPSERPAVPAGMDWDLWLGPAKKRAYSPLYHPHGWRWWWVFGSDAIGDMGCHNMDPAFMALKLGSPETIEAYCDRVDEETTPQAAIYYYSFAERGGMPAVKVTWYSGGLMPRRPMELEEGRELTGKGNGILFVGDNGKIMCPGWSGNPRIIPESKMREYKLPPRTLPRSKGHHRDWVDGCKGGKPASSNFDYGGPLTEMMLLGTVALRSRGIIHWDGENMKATNCPQAEQYIRPEYHNGWTL